MIHARTDYQRIIDLAAQAALLDAFRNADAKLRGLSASGADIPETVDPDYFELKLLHTALAPLVALVDALPEGTRPIGDDVPVFLIVGRKDSVAAAAVREYAHLARHAGVDFDFTESCIAHAKRIDAYQSANLSGALPNVPAAAIRPAE